jgi:hypothetical protein
VLLLLPVLSNSLHNPRIIPIEEVSDSTGKHEYGGLCLKENTVEEVNKKQMEMMKSITSWIREVAQNRATDGYEVKRMMYCETWPAYGAIRTKSAWKISLQLLIKINEKSGGIIKKKMKRLHRNWEKAQIIKISPMIPN